LQNQHKRRRRRGGGSFASLNVSECDHETLYLIDSTGAHYDVAKVTMCCACRVVNEKNCGAAAHLHAAGNTGCSDHLTAVEAQIMTYRQQRLQLMRKIVIMKKVTLI